MSDGEETLVQELENLRTENAGIGFIDFLTILGRQIVEADPSKRLKGQSTDLGDWHEEKLDSTDEGAHHETVGQRWDDSGSQQTSISVQWKILFWGVGCTRFPWALLHVGSRLERRPKKRSGDIEDTGVLASKQTKDGAHVLKKAGVYPPVDASVNPVSQTE